ncbi:MAG TPA: 3-oxoacyl-[acyl-carrier-protein] synthase III C-terminal domain-containing protein [Candidatus Binataceae bacterium]|nr:3-oxoacyl-[acyl-carrier-protein] synthase III C-terminal domain-containing protein [Candidatus Binataceae bacterium]
MLSAPSIAAVATALPKNYVSQQELTAALRELWMRRYGDVSRFDRLQGALGIQGRYLALPMRDYYAIDSFANGNDAWLRVAPELAETASRKALQRARLTPRDIDHLFFVTVTGIATPTIDVALSNRLEMRRDLKRTPIFGLGCGGGAAGLARTADYVRGFSRDTAMLLSVELCSLTLQKDDLSAANIIASGLFGDGAAAVVVSGADRNDSAIPRIPRIIATRSILFPDTQRIIGWEVVDGGFKIVLSPHLTELVRSNIRREVDDFLSANNLARAGIAHWIAHTGGPKVLRVLEDELQLPEGALARSWRSLKNTGNLSSASVLFMLEDIMRGDDARAGDYGVMIAMGPGFSVELVLLGW